MSFQGGASTYALYNMESSFNKYIFTTYLISWGLETKDNYLREAW